MPKDKQTKETETTNETATVNATEEKGNKFANAPGAVAVRLKGGGTYLVSHPDGYFGVLDRPRRVGEKVAGAKKDERPQYRDNILMTLPTTPAGEHLVNLFCSKYLIGVDGADLGLYNATLGSNQDVVNDTDQLAERYFADVAAKLAEEAEDAGIEGEYKTAAEYFRNVKQKAANAAKERGDEAKAATYLDEKKFFKAATVRAIYLGTYTQEVAEARKQAIIAKVDEAKASSEADADV